MTAGDSPAIARSLRQLRAVPENLIESEFSARERRFTARKSAGSGRFEQADGGTLFLDEIGEIPLPRTVKLLRVLQDAPSNGSAETNRSR